MVIAPVIALCLGQILYWRDEREESRSLVMPSMGPIEVRDGWLDIYVPAYRIALLLQRQAHGKDVAVQVVDRAEGFARQRGLATLRELAIAWRLETLLHASDLAAANELVGHEQLTQRHRQHAQNWRATHAQGLALAQWHLIAGRPASALPILHQLRELAVAQSRSLDLCQVDGLLAMTYRQRGDGAKMVESILHALDYVATESAARALLDLQPPIEALLQTVAGEKERLPSSARATLDKLLDIIRGQRGGVPSLSEREVAVLEYLTKGMSNKRIAWVLGVSENTVKFHLKRIYGKLRVESRSAAIAAAADAGFDIRS